MSYAQANAQAAIGAERPIGEATGLARNNLARLDSAYTRLEGLLARIVGPEPRAVSENATRSNDAVLLATLQRTDGVLDALFQLIDRIESAV